MKIAHLILVLTFFSVLNGAEPDFAPSRYLIMDLKQCPQMDGADLSLHFFLQDREVMPTPSELPISLLQESKRGNEELEFKVLIQPGAVGWDIPDVSILQIRRANAVLFDGTICPVHHGKLSLVEVPISYGAQALSRSYYEASLKLFPYAERRIAGGCCVSDSSPKTGFTLVCKDCEKAREDYRTLKNSSHSPAQTPGAVH